jgi:hypothetical protein
LNEICSSEYWRATVVTLYLLPSLNLKLIPKLLADLKPGTRIVSTHSTWAIGNLSGRNAGGSTVYFWTIPAKGTPNTRLPLGSKPKLRVAPYDWKEVEGNFFSQDGPSMLPIGRGRANRNTLCLGHLARSMPLHNIGQSPLKTQWYQAGEVGT